jgi:hypothetical protein
LNPLGIHNLKLKSPVFYTPSLSRLDEAADFPFSGLGIIYFITDLKQRVDAQTFFDKKIHFFPSPQEFDGHQVFLLP